MHAHAGRSAQAKLCGKARLSAAKEAQGLRIVCVHAGLSELWRNDCDCMSSRPQVGNLHDQHSQLHMAEEAFKCFEGATAVVVADDR